MATTIRTNGSRWFGQEPATIDELIEVLEHNHMEVWSRARTLNPNECETLGAPLGSYHFWGNFEGLSHCFDILTDEPVIVVKLARAFRDNTRRCGRTGKGMDQITNAAGR